MPGRAWIDGQQGRRDSAAQSERRSGERRRCVESGKQREPIGCGCADQDPAGHADRDALNEGEVCPDESGQRCTGRERQRGIENDEEGGHPTSTQILICWSAELCGMAVQIG